MYKRKNRLRFTKEPETIGELMLHYRLRAHMCQSKMAELMGTRQSRISEYETGVRTPSKRTIRKFISIFSAYPWQSQFMELYYKAYLESNSSKKNRLDSLN